MRVSESADGAVDRNQLDRNLLRYGHHHLLQFGLGPKRNQPDLASGIFRSKVRGFSVLEHKLHQWVGFDLGACGIIGTHGQQRHGPQFALAQSFELRAAALDGALLHNCVFLFLDRVELIKQASRREPERCGGFPAGPHVHQAMQCVFALLNSLLVTERTRLGAFGPANRLRW